MPADASIYPGKRFTRLRVVCQIYTNEPREEWLCECECGRLTKAVRTQLISNLKLSCGCRSRADLEKVPRVKDIPSKVYRAWHRARRKGHLIPRWHDDARLFYRDIGDPPTNFCTLRRRDPSKKIGPSNWYWAGLGGAEIRIVQT